MKKIIPFVLIIFVMACESAHVQPDNTPNLRAMSAAEVQITRGVNDFTFDLFKRIDEPAKNSFMSPLSVSMALGMVMNGTSDETRQSILNTIDYSEFTAAEVNQAYKDLTELLLSMDRTVTMDVANSVWHNRNYAVNRDFVSIVRQQYDAKVEGLNFSADDAKNTINNWVANKTREKITKVIERIAPEDVMFLINAIYFKGSWAQQFDKTRTSVAPFKTVDGTSVTADMMHAKDAVVQLYQNDEVQVVDVPYGNGQFSFTIVAPFSNLNEMTGVLDAAQLTGWISHADSTKITLRMPRFKMRWQKDLKETLMSMGMKINGFPNLFESISDNLEISKVDHQAYLDVNEEGTEAAAVTTVGIQLTSAPIERVITIDRPFLFMIREKHSGVILFMGKLVNPSDL
ncbi:serpin family protein [Fulvivirgaceae bacterium PWU4]|uniref:Serpin family protein n=1 Tax=Chryseosolibacter histidini TaxID=2782349 RepID=A0AAP2GJ78_9BACT|nr:serpin family protein [Chryseosolibacter histidini]MBT1697734.1 serpin family protein [Chryseosolibacter histidini]